MRSRTWKLVRLAAPLGLIPLFACLSPPVESPKTTVTQETSVRVEQSVKNKVDLLFLIDNSPSMAPKQTELANRFPTLIKALQNFAMQGNPASYHIGVVTSDLGAGPFTLNQGQCHPGGDGAKLAGHAGRRRDAAPGVTCTNFALVGRRPLHRLQPARRHRQHHGRPDVPTAFSCMAAVGEAGCGFEHQLESPYRALHDTIPENAGFLRSDAHPRRRLRHRRRRLLGAADERSVRPVDQRRQHVRHAALVPLHAVRRAVRRHAGAADVDLGPAPAASRRRWRTAASSSTCRSTSTSSPSRRRRAA